MSSFYLQKKEEAEKEDELILCKAIANGAESVSCIAVRAWFMWELMYLRDTYALMVFLDYIENLTKRLTEFFLVILSVCV